MLTTTAKTAAERKREQRERQKQNRLKDVTFTLDQATIDIVTSHSKQQGINQSDYVNNALKAAVTSHDNGSLQAEIDQLKQANFALVEQRDHKHLRVIKLQSELMIAKTEPAKLKVELSAAKRELSKQQTRFCQCLTAAGYQCTKPATHENKHNGFILWTCEQHYQSVINSNRN